MRNEYMLIDLGEVSWEVWITIDGSLTHPVDVSKRFNTCGMSQTYYSDFATELVLDLALLDRLGCMLLNELVQVLDTHLDEFASVILSVLSIQAASRSISERGQL
jgi:hypothetical protein